MIVVLLHCICISFIQFFRNSFQPNYKSIFVGDRLNSNLATGGAQGIFFSVQGQNVPWQDLADKSKFIQTQAGAFANFAKYTDGNKDIYPFAVALYDALRGTARVDTCIGGKGC